MNNNLKVGGDFGKSLRGEQVIGIVRVVKIVKAPAPEWILNPEWDKAQYTLDQSDYTPIKIEPPPKV